MRRSRTHQRTRQERDLKRSGTEERSSNRSIHATLSNRVNRAQLTKPSLDSRNIQQPAIATLDLGGQTVGPSLSKHVEHGFVSPNPNPAVDG